LLKDSVQYLKGIGPKKADILKDETGIENIEDLLYYVPRRYLDWSMRKKIRDCFVNETVTITGTITSVSVQGNRKKFLQVMISDGTDSLAGIFFGGVFYFQKIFNPGDTVVFSGRIDYFRTRQIVHPEFDLIDNGDDSSTINTGRIVPLYPSTEKLKMKGLDSRGFRRIISQALSDTADEIHEPFDTSMLERLKMPSLKDAIWQVHFPDSLDAAEQARRRLSFNELFFLQYYLLLSREYAKLENMHDKPRIDTTCIKHFIDNLPFTLTNDQEKAIDEIHADIASPCPMNRMLQGDVGSGKTVVAMAAALATVGQKQQVAIMAPTEVLAVQHYNNFRNLIPDEIRIELLTGSTSAGEKERIYNATRDGTVNIIIGTHALIQEGVDFKNLGFIIIDEQHRFGVNQRAMLRAKGISPDLLVMTATPIPRSLSLTLYGDLDISIIKQKPANRLTIQTMSFPESRLKGVYNSLEKYMSKGQQVYYVLPLIEDSEKVDLKSAKATYEHLKNKIFPARKIALLHGRMPAEYKEKIMRDFHNKDIHLLVSTTVIEVGVDIPNASIMVVHHAERFGLSQLHQLRGRVGRGAHQSFCVLIYPDDLPEENKTRINILTSTDDGFAIAEEDLKIRGAGEFTGTRQHGYVSSFEFADVVNDFDLITMARQEATLHVAKAGDLRLALEAVKSDQKYATILEGLRTKHILAILS